MDNILNVEFFCDVLDEKLTIRQYFQWMALTVWRETEGFSGKRPFGESGWCTDIFLALVDADVIKGTIDRDEDGFIEEYDISDAERKKADKLIDAALLKEITWDEQ